MGMFDEVRCKYPIEWPEVQGADWQTKDTPEQHLAVYEIRDDGTIWERSVETKYPMHHGLPEEGLPRTVERWTRLKITGEIEIHHLEKSTVGQDWWYSVQFWFRDGVVKDVVCHRQKSGLDCDTGAGSAGGAT
jgi:hypothetical protein